ncbi:MAG: tyrosine-protein phosphatase [Lachnospiraceae bacterium]|nr:tyrosine-protein phosphatase [Lachnospiraceae bacterium]
MKRIKQVIQFFLILCLFTGALSGCSLPGNKNIKISDMAVIHEEEFGGVYIDLTIDEFNALGFEFGDSVDISFSNGYKLQDIPYYNGYYAHNGDPELVGYPGYPYIDAAIVNGESMWELSGLKEGDSAEIKLVKKGKYLDIQEARDIHYQDDRSLYESDAVFANFRSVDAAGIRADTLYRSASPCDNQHNRAGYTDRLAEKAKIGFIINLADDDEKIMGYIAEEDFDSPYFLSLYNDGNVIPLAVNTDYNSDLFRGKLTEGLRAMIGHEGPYLIHCTEGKDRTGFVCILLEALCGAGYDDIEKDYMTSYDNYYGITKDSDKKRYETIVNDVMIPLIYFITDDEKVDVKKADLSVYAANYLKKSGLTGDEIEKLKERICR